MFNVGEQIKKLREEKGMTMEMLAEKTGVSKSAVSKWETGDIKNVSRKSIENVANALGTTPSHIMGWDGDVSEDDSVKYYSSRLDELQPRDRNAVYSLIDYYLRS